MSTTPPAPAPAPLAGFLSRLICDHNHTSVTEHRKTCRQCAKIAEGFPALENPPRYVYDIGERQLEPNATLTELRAETPDERATAVRRQSNLKRMASAALLGTRTRNRRAA